MVDRLQAKMNLEAILDAATSSPASKMTKLIFSMDSRILNIKVRGIALLYLEKLHNLGVSVYGMLSLAPTTRCQRLIYYI